MPLHGRKPCGTPSKLAITLRVGTAAVDRGWRQQSKPTAQSNAIEQSKPVGGCLSCQSVNFSTWRRDMLGRTAEFGQKQTGQNMGLKVYAASFRAHSVFAIACFMSSGCVHASSDCSTTSSHADQRKCLERVASATQAKLEKAQALLVERIEAWDEGPDYRQRAVKLLKQSFARFTEFRDTECKYEAAAAAGGNGAGDMGLQCQIDMNRQYADSLCKQLAWYPSR